MRDCRRFDKIFNRSSILWFVIFVLLWSCSDGEPPASVSEKTGQTLRLIIKWAGDDLASKQDLELRNQIVQRLVEKKVGSVVRSGTGMGWMDIVLEVSDPDKARPEIKTIVNAIAPQANFAIQSE